ncbi:hypothetical protein [Pontibacter cellulosilyticus]|uniref:Uncharacterized protein n=1 Tax=Pontibacter cellulosilyticus TaxID=1720253 RepID=A0A923N5W3_9BACT|nr:hypothetical protein [Pontibacter cellulosilyticus]MBC5992749.1 hypothetical protein [Pontibacter cellulosilyticus]
MHLSQNHLYLFVPNMLHRFILASLLVCACCLTACNSDSETQAVTQETADTTQLPETPQPEVSNEVSYEERLQGGGMRFDVRTTGLGSQRSLAIIVERDEQLPVRIDEAIEGTVTKSVVADLNDNKKPELLVFVSGSGSGSYGKVYGYEFEREYWGELTIPELSPELQKDYMGHDEFKVVNDRLIRTFPIYLETDPNCCPTGGTRTITYTLNNALNLAVEKVE